MTPIETEERRLARLRAILRELEARHGVHTEAFREVAEHVRRQETRLAEMRRKAMERSAG